MRIFVAVDTTPNAKDLASSSVWERNLVDPLLDLGHEVVRFKYDLTPFSFHSSTTNPADVQWQATHRPELEEALLRQVRQQHQAKPLALFLSYFWDVHATPGVIREIRALGILTANWYCNASFQLHQVKTIAPAFDYCLVPEKFRLADYRALGARPVYFQEAANPKFYQPQAVPRDLGVTFVGQCYGDRVNYATALHRAGLPLDIYGPRWVERARHDATWGERCRRWPPVLALRNGLRRLRGRPAVRREAVPREVVHPPLSDEEMVTLYSRSKISLGFSTCGNTDQTGQKILQVRLRDMEATMCGAFYLVERFEELGECYAYGQEIEGYGSVEELIDKCRYYLRHEAERERIRAAGQRRALAEHTWQKRFSDFFRQIGLIS